MGEIEVGHSRKYVVSNCNIPTEKVSKHHKGSQPY